MSNTDGGLPVRTYRYAVILPHPTEPRVLLMPCAGGWSLPAWETGHLGNWEATGPVNELVRARLGVTSPALRAVLLDDGPGRGVSTGIYELEPCKPHWTLPSGALWIDQDKLARLDLAHNADRAALVTWFRDAGFQRPTPWYNPGWRATAESWFREQADAAGYTPTGAITFVRAWQRSAVLRLPTSSGNLFFKAVPPMFAHEQRLNRYLEAHVPNQSPQTVAFDADRHWSITRDFGGRLLLDVPDLEVWLDAYRRYAELQIALSDRLGDLRALGCPWRPLAERTQLIEPLLHDGDLLLLGRDGGLTHAQAEALRAGAPRLRERWQALAASPIPMSLDHGDLWPANMAVCGDDIIFFDWSDCALTHPFLCFILSGPEAQAAFPNEPKVAERVRDAYLDPWRAHLPSVDVDAAFDLTWRVGALYYAMLYAYDILPHLIPRWELERMVPFYLRLVLERLDGP